MGQYTTYSNRRQKKYQYILNRWVCKVHVRKRGADALLQRSNMSIEKGLSTGCTPAECYVDKRTRRDFVLTVGISDFQDKRYLLVWIY